MEKLILLEVANADDAYEKKVNVPVKRPQAQDSPEEKIVAVTFTVGKSRGLAVPVAPPKKQLPRQPTDGFTMNC